MIIFLSISLGLIVGYFAGVKRNKEVIIKSKQQQSGPPRRKPITFQE